MWGHTQIGQVLGGPEGSRRAPSCEVWRSLAKIGETNAKFTRISLTFIRVPAKVSAHWKSKQRRQYGRCVDADAGIQSSIDRDFLREKQSNGKMRVLHSKLFHIS